ncbi:MAG: hypothetical protein LUE65_01250 [Clostridiales bacterium]|nr:hypothetical protein [Clostridiales bacterium]
MLKLTFEELTGLSVYLDTLPVITSSMLEGFACSASDNSCGCGWDCSSTKT